ncbi:MAG: hypothetical protein HQM09_07160 [Candidatus Riflebacteria bacterium]|nr:hypothetical protein [Candidatus Riflebacteria bacterium]
MNETDAIHEKFVFFSARKEQETMFRVLEMVLALELDEIRIEYRDRPAISFSHFNDRAKKIIMSLESPEKVEHLDGIFSGGGTFELRGGTFSFTIPAEQYNFEVIDSMRHILSPVFPVCIFHNPYIWGVDLYELYERERLFETRTFISRSQRLEDPQIDIFRRDEGIIFKFRFHLKDSFSLGVSGGKTATSGYLQDGSERISGKGLSDTSVTNIDEGVRFLHPVFVDLIESIRKRNYEGMEVLHLYCIDRPLFRKTEPRTKLGIKIKSMLYDR